MVGRRYWAAVLFLVAALNILIGIWILDTADSIWDAGSVVANYALAALLFWLGMMNLKTNQSYPRISGPLSLPQTHRLPFVLFPNWPISWEDALTRFRPSTPSGRGLKLLLSYLDERQREELLATEAFTFQAPSGKWFRILPTTYYAVHQVKDPNLWLPTHEEGTRGLDPFDLVTRVVDRAMDNITGTWCAYPRPKDRYHPLPIEDVMLAVYLRILANEEEFMRIANWGSASSISDYFFRVGGRRGTCLRSLNKVIRAQGWLMVFRALEA